MNIKNLRPKKNSRYKQGYINKSTCKKYVGEGPIIYRSSWERTFIVWCENNPNIIAWSSECVRIPYIFEGEQHSYYPDFAIKTKDGSRYLIEIKPKNQSIITDDNEWLSKVQKKNRCKWKAAIEVCEQNGYQFKVITEYTISQLFHGK